MVSLSLRVLQCNLLANVSTVEGKPAPKLLCSLNSYDLALKHEDGSQHNSSGLTKTTSPLALHRTRAIESTLCI